MVIHLSPHTEPVHHIQEFHIKELQVPDHGTDPAAQPLEEPRHEQDEPGLFARLLAAVSDRKSAAEDTENTFTETAGLDKKGLVHAGTETRAGNPAAADGAIKTHEAGAPELPAAELSEQEKNILFTVGIMAGNLEEQKTIGEKSGETASETFATANIAANAPANTAMPDMELATASTAVQAEDSPLGGRETLKAKTAGAAAAKAESAAAITAEKIAANATETAAADNAGKQSPASAVANAEENRKNTSAKSKTLAETAVNSGSVAEKASGEILSQQTDAKKTVISEKDGRNRLEEGRNRRRVSLEVHDFRNQSENSIKESGAQLRVANEARLSGEGTVKDMILELRLPNQSSASSWETRAGQAGQSFENMLARELHQNLNSDIVRHASVILREGNEGTIRLALKPESLGNVKIHLEMAENKIAGQIIVESEEALRAFRREISSLEQAFRESGFDAANLEMSLAEDGKGAEEQWREADTNQILPGRIAASRYDAAFERIEASLPVDIYYHSAMAINVLA